ncbi:MAG TPA: hypothetical protein PKI19_07285 [Elusimicrobiales bacterium]|nr:hypothetical protein [Elusimicrobiales bacterium]
MKNIPSKLRTCAAAPALFLLCAAPAAAWFSMGLPWDPNLKGDTHERLSKDAVDAVVAEAPDMSRGKALGSFVWEATEGFKDDAKAHDGNGKANDGNYRKYWRLALKRYNSLHFNGKGHGKASKFEMNAGAYWYIGRMLHLVEDMAVPAHAYNIFHAKGLNFDNFELNAGHRYRSGPVTPVRLDSPDPLAYHDAARDRTIEVIVNDLIPVPQGKPWSSYWGPRSYGSKDDTFPKRYPKGNAEENALVANQLAQARDYGAGFLIAVSKALPPLVRNFHARAEARDDGLYTVNLTFTVLENRRPDITIFMQGEGGDLLQGTDLTSGRSETLEKGEVLPWMKNFSLQWAVRGAPGSEMTLKVMARDTDGNFSVPAKAKLKFRKQYSLSGVHF